MVRERFGNKREILLTFMGYIIGPANVWRFPYLVLKNGGGEFNVNPVLNWANICSPNILRTDRRTMIRFLIELLVRRT